VICKKWERKKKERQVRRGAQRWQAGREKKSLDMADMAFEARVTIKSQHIERY
jgi:hypothetical protein